MSRAQWAPVRGDASERVVTQSIGTTLNVHRPQSLHGDIFINHAGALSFNDTSGWDADQNDVRIATTLTNTEYPHTFAGLGIDHVESTWRGAFKSAPISAYCAINDAYGNVSQGDPAGGANFTYETACTLDDGSTFTYRPVDHAIFVR